MKINIILLIAILVFSKTGFSQGFANLNFENATFTVDPSGLYYPYSVYASNAIPGWTAYVGGSPVSDVLSNNVLLSGGAVSIIGTNNNLGFQPIQGKYFMLLAGDNYSGSLGTAGIGQSNTIPLSAESLIFWGNVGANDVSFYGQTLVLTVLGSTANYNIYGANISAFAGQTGQLLFTTVLGGSDMIDNIQFSSSAVPEPSALGLSALGGLLLAWRCRART